MEKNCYSFVAEIVNLCMAVLRKFMMPGQDHAIRDLHRTHERKPQEVLALRL